MSIYQDAAVLSPEARERLQESLKLARMLTNLGVSRDMNHLSEISLALSGTKHTRKSDPSHRNGPVIRTKREVA